MKIYLKKHTPKPISVVITNLGAEKKSIITSLFQLTGFELEKIEEMIDNIPFVAFSTNDAMEAEVVKSFLMTKGAEVEIKYS